MFGRAWPLRAPVRDGYVPTWPQLLNGEEVPCTVSNTNLLSAVPDIYLKQDFTPRSFLSHFFLSCT